MRIRITFILPTKQYTFIFNHNLSFTYCIYCFFTVIDYFFISILINGIIIIILSTVYIMYRQQLCIERKMFSHNVAMNKDFYILHTLTEYLLKHDYWLKCESGDPF